MKKLLIGSLILLTFQTQAQNMKPLAALVTSSYNEATAMHPVLFSESVASPARQASGFDAFAADATFMVLDPAAQADLYALRPASFSMEVMVHGEPVKLLLVQQNILAEDFRVTTSSHPEGENYSPGVYYRGIIQGDETSLAAISVFEDGLMGLFSGDLWGNVNIGPYTAPDARSMEYVVLAERDLLVNDPFSCATPENSGPETFTNPSGTRTINVPQVYIEADYQLYQNKGSVSNTVNYLTGVFNNSATIYANDGITVENSEIFVWTSDDPYSEGSSFAALSSFQSYRTVFNGDVAHLCALDAGGLGGVAATIDGLCNSNKYCYSDIDASYSDFPTYSWTVMVFTHELGHLFGSHHTQWCGWPGGAIDNCYSTEGGCGPGPAPVSGGTIMSYCHLTGYGINFSNGFGPLPADAIVSTIETAPCLDGGGVSEEYCVAGGSNASEEWIDRVRLGSINRVSGSDGGYYDGTSMSVNMKQGMSKYMRVSAGMAGGPYTEYWKVWIDFNQDLDFDDPGEEIFSLASTLTSNIPVLVSIPADASTGSTRMRITMKYGSAPAACELYAYGETEDYTINITPMLPEALIAAEPFVVSPNPVADLLGFYWEEMAGEDLQVVITSLTGQVVASFPQPAFSGACSMQVNHIPAGIYAIQATTSNGMELVQQFIKQ